MTETRARTETEAPTVRMVCDLGPRQQIASVSHTLADVTAMMACLYRFRPYFRDPDASRDILAGWDVPLESWRLRRVGLEPSPLPTVYSGETPMAFLLQAASEPGPEVLHVNYRNPLELWLALGTSAAVSASVILPRFSEFVVSVGAFLRDYGADRRIRIAEARAAEAQADVAESLATRAALGRDELTAITRLREVIAGGLAETHTTDQTRGELEEATDRSVSVEDAAAMVRVGSTVTDFEDVTGQEPPSESA